MIEIRFHGRGGQGAVLASEMLATIYFESGKFVQAFPAFGVERRGAPVLAFTRVDDNPIEIHFGVYQPDRLIVLDQTVLETIDVTRGLKKDGMIVINSNKKSSEFDMFKDFNVFTVDVNAIALRHKLGAQSSPIVNTAILGAYAAADGSLPVELVKDIVISSVPVKKEDNASAAVEAYETVIAYG